MLREARLVTVRKDAQRRIYRIEASGFEEVDDWLDSVRQFWNQRLDQLERVLGKQDEGDQS